MSEGEVSGGVLWLGPLFATQTSILHTGWTTGRDLEDAGLERDVGWDAEPLREEFRDLP